MPHKITAILCYPILGILTLLLGDFGTPPTPAKELSAARTTPILAMKLNVLLHGTEDEPSE